MDPDYDKHGSELVARERSGHTAVVENNLLYVWGGYMLIAGEEVCLPNDEMWVYDLERGVWKLVITTGEVPPSMSGSCCCSLNGHMYIFGGFDDMGQTNEVYCVNLTEGKYVWRKITPEKGSAPTPRDKLSCWVYNGRIIYFGGYGGKPLYDVDSRDKNFVIDQASQLEDVLWGWNNEVHTFDPKQASWSQPQTNGQAPSPRAAQASATLGQKGYISGGYIMERWTSELYCLDLESWTWSEIVSVSTPSPVGRTWHTLTAVSDTSLFLFGGLSVDCTPLSDQWMFDVVTKTWKEVKHCSKIKPRFWHTACLGEDSDVIVFGGISEYISDIPTGHSNDVVICQMQPYPLSRICEDYITKNARISEVIRNQLPLLPPKLLTLMQRRMTLSRP